MYDPRLGCFVYSLLAGLWCVYYFLFFFIDFVFFLVLQVIHYELPNSSEIFVHRSGRTGRAGKKGTAVLVHTRDQARSVKMIERDVGSRFTEVTYNVIYRASVKTCLHFIRLELSREMLITLTALSSHWFQYRFLLYLSKLTCKPSFQSHFLSKDINTFTRPDF